MKRILNIFLSAFILFHSANAAQASGFRNLENFPALREVATRYVLAESPDQLRSYPPGSYRFMRTPEGWYLKIDDFSQQNISLGEKILIWSSKTGYAPAYRGASGNKNAKNQAILSGVINNSDLYNFSIHPFYGYVGWGSDVIEFYRGMESAAMDDNELYGLARAYGQRASDIFWAHNLFSDTARASILKGRETAVEQYLYFAQASISTYQVLYERNPDYYTLIGGMDIKLANEIMSHWYELTLFGFEEEARYLLRIYQDQQGYYQDFWVEYARTLLGNLPEGAILFTNGDNDTYPLLYQQYANHLREDVVIINIALLKDPQYLVNLKKNLSSAKGIELGLTEAELLRLKERQLVLEDEEYLPNLSISKTDWEIKNGLEGDNPIIPISGGTYHFDSKTGKVRIRNYLKPRVSNSVYLFLELTGHQSGSRPICLAKSVSLDLLNLIDPENLVDQGFHYYLSGNGDSFEKISGYVFDKEAYQNILYPGFNHPPTLPHKARSGFYRQVIQMHSRMLQYMLITEPELFTCDSIQRFFENYPPAETGSNVFYYEILYLSFQGDELCRNSAVLRMKEFVNVLETETISLEMTDQDPNDYGNLIRHQYLINLIMKHKEIAGFEGIDSRLDILSSTIKERLNELPEIELR